MSEAAKIVVLGGRRWAILPEGEYRRLVAEVGRGPPLPMPDAEGNYPAVEYARASLARKIVRMRTEAGLSQAELARRAGIRVETLNRIERGKRLPATATLARIQRALEEAE